MPAVPSATWPGVIGFISCEYTCSHGITPGIASLVIPEQDVNRIAAYGELWLSDGINLLKLPRCKIVDLRYSGGVNTPRTITLLIADRRWQWKFGGISGNWNQIDPYPDPSSFPPDEFIASGGPYMPGTYRTAEKLMADCLAAMNESDPLISPAPIIPIAVQWDNENPAQALQGLCDTLGYRIVYQPFYDKVVVCPLGAGFPLPDSLPVMAGADGIAPPARPNGIQLVGGQTLFNDYLDLEPIGFEQDGTMKLIDDLSYKPTIGWGRCAPPNFAEVSVQFGPEKCALAQQHIWRSFRVKIRDVSTFDTTGITVPGYGKVTDRKQIVLGTQCYGLSKDERGQQRSSPAYCVGSVYRERGSSVPTAPGGDDLTPFGNTLVDSGRLPVHPQIDPDRGVVTFSAHMVQSLVQKPGDTVDSIKGSWGPPILYLFTSFKIRNLAGMVFSQFSAAGASAVTADPLCPPEIIRHPELTPVVFVTRNTPQQIGPAFTGFTVADVQNNFDDLLPAANYYLAAADVQYSVDATGDRTYSGIQIVSPDGAIQQVTWSLGGGLPVTTRASRNTEHKFFIPPYPERRQKEKVNNFWGHLELEKGEASASITNTNTSPGQARNAAFQSAIPFGFGTF